MKPESTIFGRRSIRMRGYDYSLAGAYFVTVCTQDRLCLFGNVNNEQMTLNQAGQMVYEQWLDLPKRFPESAIDEFTMMPNHLHGILIINDNETTQSVGAPLVGAQNKVDKTNKAGTRPAPTLGEIVGAFKSITTNEYIRGVKQHDWPSFPGKLWQRNYGACPERSRRERFIRDEDELNRIREYIILISYTTK